ncbi:MAG: hypothetical protein KBT31_07130 [Firmicutes bacterium]|nr:hypothetical protein [Candidatus Colimorpha enterica]
MNKTEYINCIIKLVSSLRKDANGKLVENKFGDVYNKTTFQPIQPFGMFGDKYILNQMLRLYVLPKDNYHISEEAEKLWGSLTSADFRFFRYEETFKCDKLSKSMNVNTCVGNGKTIVPKNISPNAKIKFNSIFITEHIVPVSFIIDKLFDLGSNPNPTYVEDILNAIHVAIILKSENAKLPNKRIITSTNSPDDWWRKVDNNYYLPNNIKLKPFP